MPLPFSKPSTDKNVNSTPTYIPPQGPPPSRSDNADSTGDAPPSYEDWMAIRENQSHAGLPPPPTIHYEHSHVNNAPRGNETRGHDFCKHNSLWSPRQYDQQSQTNIQHGRTHLAIDSFSRGPSKHNGLVQQLSSRGRDEYRTFFSDKPLYSAVYSHPYTAKQKFTAYYEIRVLEMDSRNGGIALGFVALPYPNFRLPGWERASMAIHGDDGHRFINDTFGGTEFTKSFKKGEAIGIGMEFIAQDNSTTLKPLLPHVRCFMVRNSQRTNEHEWDLREEIDSKTYQPDGVAGLGGDRDLHAAVGVYGKATVEVRFSEEYCSWWPS